MISKALVKRILKTYKEAWEKQDPEKIVTIFAKNAVYHERLHEKPFKGHNEIKSYWKNKVVGEEKNIKFKLKRIYVDGNTAIVEWEAKFYYTKENVNKHLKGIAVLEVKNNKIKSLREYWQTKNWR